MKDSKLKILLVVRHPLGGIRTFVKYLYNALDPDEYSFVVVAPFYRETEIMLQDVSSLDVRFIPVNKEKLLWDLFCKVSKELMREQYDIVHSHGLKSCIASAIPAKLCRVPHVVTFHDVFAQKQFSGASGLVKKTVINAVTALVDKVHFVSHDSCNVFCETTSSKLDRRKHVVLRNGIAVEKFRSCSPRDFRQELSLHHGDFLLGFCGRFMSPKGFVHLARAMKYVLQKKKNVYLLAFGSDGFIREDSAYVKSLGIDRNVIFLPFEPDLGPVLKALDLLVMPSLWEACGLLAMEALVCGVPLIASDCIGLREVTRDTPAIGVPAMDDVAIAEAICEEIDHPSTERFAAFVDTAAAMFDVRKQAEGISTLYDELYLRARGCRPFCQNQS